MPDSPETKIPPVLILASIRPTNSGTGEDTLNYASLEGAVDKYRATHTQRLAEAWDSTPGSLEELSAARELALEYLLRDAEMVVDSDDTNRDLWAKRFTHDAIELYGEPDPDEATRLISNEYALLTTLRGDENISQPHLELLLDVYKPMAVSRTETHENDRQQAAIHEYGEAMRSKYQGLFDLVDVAGLDSFAPEDLHELFSKALDWLATHDDLEWKDWTLVDVDKTDLGVESGDREIRNPLRRELATPVEVKGLIAHELLVHALRIKNGYKTGDRKLATGLPGYLDAEEGLGVLAEAAITGSLPDKVYDRYLDIALALGTVDGVQRTRRQMFDISYARQLIRSQLAGTPVNPHLASKVWKHVDRIYRGGKGDEAGTQQAIFTKDIAYYEGYQQMVTYISKQLDRGKSAKDIFEYLSLAKFDPTNPQHVERLLGKSRQ